ncbi:MAG: hypothetical protein JHC80_07180 [Polynucleobacter sp.]|nr:hypothetical protein [Polynucleobacter sp.]
MALLTSAGYWLLKSNNNTDTSVKKQGVEAIGQGQDTNPPKPDAAKSDTSSPSPLATGY